MVYALLSAFILTVIPSQDVYGSWITNNQDSIITIKICENTSPCGYIESINTDITGSEKDLNNPAPILRERSLVGVMILSNFKNTPKGWKHGTIYDPGTGKSYKAHLRRISKTHLEVKACMGPFCERFIWSLTQ